MQFPDNAGEKDRHFIELLNSIDLGMKDIDQLKELLTRFLQVIGGQSICLYSYDRAHSVYMPSIVEGEGANIIRSCPFQEDNGIAGELEKSGDSVTIRKSSELEKDVVLDGLGKTLNFSISLFAQFIHGKHDKYILAIFGEPDRKSYDESDIILLKAFIKIVELLLERRSMTGKIDTQNRELAQKDFDLYTVYQVSKTLSSILDVEELTRLLADMLSEVMTAESAIVFLTDEEDSHLKICAYKSLDPDAACPYLEFSTTERTVDWLLSHITEVKIITDFNEEPFKQAFPEASQVLKEMNIKLLVPMVHKYKLVGFLGLGNKYVGVEFSQRDYDFLLTIAPLAANAISNAHLYELAILDGLTRVFIGRYFQQRCKEELKRATRYKQVLSLIMWDIDHFKEVNDRFGHLAGDAVLKEITAIFRKNYRQGIDLIGRYGGEEFVMLLPDTPRQGAKIMAERLRKSVEEHRFCDGKIRLTVSGGISSFPEDGKTYNELIEKADIFLYEAKRKGRNRICTLEQETV